MLWVFTISVHSEPIISEIVAENLSGYSDDDQDRSDWIELFNPDESAWSLNGWALSDDPASLNKWQFPDISIGARSYLVVFASGKDRRNLGAPLHTNFRLAAKGEFLALTNPAGQSVSLFEPSFPKQFPDISYGIGQSSGKETILLEAGSRATALIPTGNEFGEGWTAIDFDDSDWLSGRTAVGYDYSQFVNLNVGAMRGQNPSVYVRVPFEWDGEEMGEQLILRLRYEDGFVAFLNGKRIAAGNAPITLSWNSIATADRPDGEAIVPTDIDISSSRALLRPGRNVLAIHGLNRALNSSDILIEPVLVAVKGGAVQNAGFIFSPTPGDVNRTGVNQVVGSPLLSSEGHVFSDPFEVILTLPKEVPLQAQIRYTLDGTIPDLGSTLYSVPLRIETTMQIRARVFDQEEPISSISSATYVQVHSELSQFSSNLPLIILENFRGGRPPQNGFQSGYMSIIESGENSRTTLVDLPKIQTRVGLKVRGSSTSGRPKPSLSLEARDEYENEIGISPLNLPRDSDWVLWGPYNFDLTLIHNPFIYELSNQIGRYAPRTRFVEVFLNTGGGALRSDDYYGVYALTEKIKRDDDRVNVKKLFPEHDREPDVSGGYVLKVDRADPGDSGFSQGGQTMRYVYPKEEDIERPERNSQEQFVSDYFRAMGRALNGSDFKDPNEGYAKYIDVDAAIDHHLLNVLAFNVDGLRLSGYMHLPRGGKLTFGPIWDFDRALGSTDGRDSNPNTWRSRSGDRGTDFFNYPWWNRMFRDIDFFQKYIDRFQSLRVEELSDVHLNGLVDAMADELREAQKRNLDRWNQRPRSQFGRTYQGEINHMKDWLGERVEFMESQFVAPPRFELSSGQLDPGGLVSLSSLGGGEIYYTVDGSDPRSAGGSVSRFAVKYLDPIQINKSAHLVARVRNLSHSSLTGSNNPPLTSQWSGPVTRVYSVDAKPVVGDLQISEVHYNPSSPNESEQALLPDLSANDFEFFELSNISQRRLSLSGVRVKGGVSFQFQENRLSELSPGASLVLVRNRNAFELRYPSVQSDIFEYKGALNNDRDLLEVLGADGVVLVQFAYEDSWYPATDGLGFSLVHSGAASVEEGALARLFYGPSHLIGGSPGQAGGRSLIPPYVVVSEVLNNSNPPELDAIELTNQGDEAMDISHWFLTDDLRSPRKFRVPEGTILETGDWLVFREDLFGKVSETGAGFGLSSRGDDVYLLSGNEAGNLTGYVDGFKFGPLPAGATQGPYINSVGVTAIVPFDKQTLGGINSDPQIGPVVISEIYSSPTRDGDGLGQNEIEFIELVNSQSSPVQLGGPIGQALSWRLRGGIRYDFPTGVELGPLESMVIASFDPDLDDALLAAFRGQWDIPEKVVVLGPFKGRLDNSGDAVRLERADPSLVFGDELEFYASEVVEYSASSPWPETQNPAESIQRLSAMDYGNDPGNWTIGVPTPGVFAVDRYSQIVSISTSDEGVLLEIEIGGAGAYALETSLDIQSDLWETIEVITIDEMSSSMTAFLDASPAKERRFYRIVSLVESPTD
ncbi:CotH kinase family protein [bacterium]|nr:CotH kinase family protein [bacterium]